MSKQHITSVDQSKINDLKESYDDFLYVSKPFSNTCITSLMAKALIYGLDPVPVEEARVLELGSSPKPYIIQRLPLQVSTYPLHR